MLNQNKEININWLQFYGRLIHGRKPTDVNIFIRKVRNTNTIRPNAVYLCHMSNTSLSQQPELRSVFAKSDANFFFLFLTIIL